MPKRTLKIALTDFWPHEAKDAPMTLYKGFFDVLRTKYDLEHSQEPELLFCSDCSVYKIEHKRYNCIKCWLGVEPRVFTEITDFYVTMLLAPSLLMLHTSTTGNMCGTSLSRHGCAGSLVIAMN